MKSVHTEMMVLHPHLGNYENVFMQCLDSTVTHPDNYNEEGSGSVVLFVENLSVNIDEFKKILF